jgi:HAD superfamily hydrolase (TIGR01509 family)
MPPPPATAAPPACRAIVFDMDGVLLDSEPVYLEVEGALVRRLAGPRADLREILPRLLGRTSPDSARITLEHFGIEMHVDEFLRLREDALYPAFGGVPFLPGVEEFVRAMKKAGVRMAVATSSPARLLEAKRAGKEEFFAMFDGVVCGDDVTCGKPDPEIFLKAAAVIGVPPGECVVFEDAPAGVRGAKAAGMRCVAFPNEDVEMALYEEAGFDLKCAGFLDFAPESMGLPRIA